MFRWRLSGLTFKGVDIYFQDLEPMLDAPSTYDLIRTKYALPNAPPRGYVMAYARMMLLREPTTMTTETMFIYFDAMNVGGKPC